MRCPCSLMHRTVQLYQANCIKDLPIGLYHSDYTELTINKTLLHIQVFICCMLQYACSHLTIFKARHILIQGFYFYTFCLIGFGFVCFFILIIVSFIGISFFGVEVEHFKSRLTAHTTIKRLPRRKHLLILDLELQSISGSHAKRCRIEESRRYYLEFWKCVTA